MSRRVVAVSFAALMTGLVVAPGAHASGPNLIPNPGFEAAYNPQPNVPTDPNKEGGFPKDWAFEGAGAPDHASTQHGPHSGTFCAAISDPASGGRSIHNDQTGQTVYPPTNTVKDDTVGVYSTVPAWRPALPIAIVPNTRYAISGWYSWDTGNEGVDGAMVRLRWLDGNGVPIRTDEWQLPATHLNASYLPWTPFSAGATSPPNAVKAIPLFGTMDNVNIIQVRWDDVALQTA